MNLIKSCILAFTMYSRFPMPEVDWSKKNMKYMLCFFPLVGAVIGLCIWGIRIAADQIGLSEGFVAACLTVVPLCLTGGIHMDGYLDTIDARSSYKSREEKLEILKDPHTGAFAVIWGGAYLLVFYGLWQGAGIQVTSILSAGFILSRALSGLSVITFPLAKDSGLAATFSGGAEKRAAILAMGMYFLGASVFMVKAGGIAGLLAVIAAIGTFLYYRFIVIREFGGVTGDLAGYFLQICELSMGIAAVIGYKF